MQDYGCIFSEYDGKFRPIFYIKIELWLKILELNNKKIDKLYEILFNNDNDNEKETFILNINDMGLPAIPVDKKTMQELLNNSYDIKDIKYENIEEICKKYNLTQEYLRNSILFLEQEVKKISLDLIMYDIKNTPNDEQDSSSDDRDSESENKE